MVDGKSLKEDMNEEKERLSRMTWEQKKEHIWEYYKIPIIAVAVLIAAVIGIVYMFRLNDYENVLYTVVTDGGIQGMDKKKTVSLLNSLNILELTVKRNVYILIIITL